MNGLAMPARFLQVKGIARGLSYLHTKDVVHGNMTMVRILPSIHRKKETHLG